MRLVRADTNHDRGVTLIKQVKRSRVERDTLYNVIKDYGDADFEKFDAALNWIKILACFQYFVQRRISRITPSMDLLIFLF